MANSWFRMYAEFANDPKVQMLSETDQRRYIMLLCIRCNGDVTLHDSEVAFQLRITNDDWLVTKAVLVAKNLVTDDNKPTAWDKRQYSSDSSVERVRKHREQKKASGNAGVTLQKPKSNAVDSDTDTDTDTKEDQKPLPAASLPAPKKVALPETELQAVCRQTWAAYADSYEQKYGAAPVRNAKVSAQVKSFVQRVGQDESVSIAEWFVSHPGDFYAKNLHSFGLLLTDAEKLRTQWATGRLVAQQPSGYTPGFAERRDAETKNTLAILTGRSPTMSLIERDITAEVRHVA